MSTSKMSELEQLREQVRELQSAWTELHDSMTGHGTAGLVDKAREEAAFERLAELFKRTPQEIGSELAELREDKADLDWLEKDAYVRLKDIMRALPITPKFPGPGHVRASIRNERKAAS